MKENKKLLPLLKAVESATGVRPHLSTVIRWVTKGTRGVRLEAVMLGGRRMTTVENVERFVDASSQNANNSPILPVVSNDRDTAIQRAKDQFAKIAHRRPDTQPK